MNPIMAALVVFEGNSPNELSIQRGEWLEVVERHMTGWTFGRNLFHKKGNDHVEGWFPDWVIQSTG